MEKTHNLKNTRTLVSIAMLSTISYLLAFLEINLPLSPSFAKMDISDLPALIASFAFSPVAGVMVELIKNTLQLLSTSTGGVGELANFIMGASFAFVSGVIYRKNKTKKMAIIACLVGSVAMSITAGLVNYFILFPLFENLMPLEELILSFAEFIPIIKTKLDIMIYNVVPFNLIKGIVISVVTIYLYKPLTPVLKSIHK